MAGNLKELLRQELRSLDTQLLELSKRREAVVTLLNTYSQENRDGKSNVVRMPAAQQPNQPVSTLSMAEQVLKKHGEMKAEQLMEAIREEFGVRPAHTLPQMLYIRARAKKRFYRTKEGKFGVIGVTGRGYSKKAA